MNARAKNIEKHANNHIHLSTNFNECCNYLQKQEYDMIIYPEIGLSPYIYFLALCRLAPIQASLIGHPDTSGSPNIDYYFSSKLFQSADIDNHFTEKLQHIPGMPIYYEFPKEIGQRFKTRQRLGLSENKKIYFCPMLLFKVHPFFDEVIESILKQDKDAEIILVCFNYIENVLRNRWKKRFGPKLLKRIKFHLAFSKKDYFSVLHRSDVIFETFPFGGGNTVLQSMAVGTPIITLPGPFLRSRFGLGFYNAIGIKDFIANSVDDYIKKSIETAHSPQKKQWFKDHLFK